MATVHLILQGKGGVGKSNVASQLTQYLGSKNLAVWGYDTDPVNSTFAGYKAFKVEVVKLLEGQRLEMRRLDDFTVKLMGLPPEDHAVVDNGAATFLPLCEYMAENPMVPMLQTTGNVFLHTVITGGQALADTLNGLNSLVNAFPSAPVVVWLNSYFGEIRSKDGRTFEEFQKYQDNKNRIHALIRIPNRSRETYGKDLETLLSRRQTYADAIADEGWNIMARQRLIIIQREMFQELDKAELL